MAASTIYGYMVTERLDGLCPKCWLPSLIHVALKLLRSDGVSEYDRGIRCAHCGPVTQ